MNDMHYNGPIVRPPTDAYSLMLEVTVGCTHNQCRFCNFYQGYPFKMAPLSQIEEDLIEVSRVRPDLKEVWAAGGNPYALSVSRLEKIALLIRKYLPQARISTYARVTDLMNKSVDDLRYLKQLGFEDLLIGIESGDDEALTFMDKGYLSCDILQQLKKLEEADVDYRVIYLGGIAGKGKCKESAIKTAKLLNQLHPYMIFLTTVAILPDTPLKQDVENGLFEEPGELERIEELKTLVEYLENEIYVYARSVSSVVDFTGYLPKDKEDILNYLKDVIDHFNENDELKAKQRRKYLKSV